VGPTPVLGCEEGTRMTLEMNKAVVLGDPVDQVLARTGVDWYVPCFFVG